MDEPKTYATFRVKGDLTLKLQEILLVLDQSSPEYFDPLVRSQIEADHARLKPAIDAIKSARAKRAKDLDEIPEMSNDIGGEG